MSSSQLEDGVVGLAQLLEQSGKNLSNAPGQIQQREFGTTTDPPADQCHDVLRRNKQ
jgi:hypothetical protein